MECISLLVVGWRPTDTALLLWMFVAAMLVGLLVSLVFGHPFDVMP